MVRATPPLPSEEAAGEILAISLAAWPLEACGVVLVDPFGACDVRGSEPVAADRFRLDPSLCLAAERHARGGGGVVVWHSHTLPGAPDGMTDHDVEGAAPDGDPLRPSAVQAVVDVRGGVARGIRFFAWDGGAFFETARCGADLVFVRGRASRGPRRPRRRSAPA